MPVLPKFKIDNTCTGQFKYSVNNLGWSRFQKNVALNQYVEFELDFKDKKKINKILFYIIRFQNFLILALNEATSFKSINLFQDVNNSTPIRVFLTNSLIQNSLEVKFDMQMLFDYQRINEDFPTIIQNWYSKYDILESSLDLIFDQFYKGNSFSENTFLNLAQAAETFHARIHNHTRISKQEYKEMQSEILRLTPNNYHYWLNDQFNFGNSLNLQTRLTELCEKYSNKVLDELIGDKELFTKQVKHSRNYYTHYSPSSKKNALKGYDLYILSEKLKAILVSAILIETGFDSKKLEEYYSNVKWLFFNHIIK